MLGGAWPAAYACQLQPELPSIWCQPEGSSLNFKSLKLPRPARHPPLSPSGSPRR